MLISDCLNINSLGHLKIGECDTIDLAKKYGTPLYVLDEDYLRKTFNLYKKFLKEYYGKNSYPLYACKAFNCLEICRIMKEEGIGIDVVSGGELYTALKAGFPPSKIHFHGNNKTIHEIEMAIKNSIGTIVVDNFEELEIVNNISKNYDIVSNVSIRITPGIDAHTHKAINTGLLDSKFGFNLENGDALKASKVAIEMNNINFIEIHCHIGSQISIIEPFILEAKIVMSFIKQIYDNFNYKIKIINLGGGLGVKYTREEITLKLEDYIKKISEVVKEKAHEYSIHVPYLLLEPGRSMIAESGITLYTVGSIKDIPGIRTFVSVDGGMCDNPRYALYRSNYTCFLANKMNKNAVKQVTIAGRCCESGDLVQENVVIPNPQRGDIIAILATGAYNYSMSSNYNRIPRPAVVMVKDSQSRIIINRETYEDVIRNDI